MLFFVCLCLYPIVSPIYASFVNKPGKSILKLVGLLLLIAAIVGSAFVIKTKYIEWKEDKGRELFQQVIECIREENFQEAEKICIEISNLDLPPDAIPNWKLHYYVEARANYNSDSLPSVENAKNKIYHLISYEGEFAADIDVFKTEIEEQYEYLKREEYKGTVPYEGMVIEDEEQLIYSDWGRPFYKTERTANVTTNTYYYYIVDGKCYSVDVYTRGRHGSQIMSIYEVKNIHLKENNK